MTEDIIPQLVKHKYSQVSNKQVHLFILFWEKISQIFTLEKVKLALKLYFWNVFDERNTFKPLGTLLPTSLIFFLPKASWLFWPPPFVLHSRI